MRIVSNQFKETMNEIIRPATKLYFEVSTRVKSVPSDGVSDIYTNYGFDLTVAPSILPSTSANEYYYAVLGNNVSVGDPNRICAPSDVANLPKGSVPFGITPYTPADTETLIGNNGAEYWKNFTIPMPSTLSFKGHIPDTIRIEVYDEEAETWSTEDTVYNPELNEEIQIIPINPDFTIRRFWVKNTTEAGRFQLNWIRWDQGWTGDAPVIFEDEYISSVNISEEMDLTSQTLPSYEMTVECLDVNEEYTPDTEYWKYQFEEGTECFFKLGYEINGITEYIPMFFGRLTQAPTYGAGKITFNVSVSFSKDWTNADFYSYPDRSLNTGDLVEGLTFKEYLEWDGWGLFDSYDVFKGADDENASNFNYYGEKQQDEARQLIANALGCYITAGIDTIDLHNATDIQYKDVDDYVTRYEQVQATLESQKKVGKIVVTRNEYRASSNPVSVTIPSRVYLRAYETIFINFKVPFYAISKYQVTDYRRSVTTVGVTAEYDTRPDEDIGEDGMVNVSIGFTSLSNGNTYIQPIIAFYGVDSTSFDETETMDKSNGIETYENNNELITNTHVANKVKRVARLISDVSNQYEVDMVQDYRYELGDVIRLETQKNVFKTCVVTGLNFTLPGSNGRITCRKIFSMLDCPYAVKDAVGLTVAVTKYPYIYFYNILETSENGVVIGRCKLGADGMDFYVLGASKLKFNLVDVTPNAILTDLNGHEWFLYCEHFADEDMDIETTAPLVELPDYDSGTGVDEQTFGAIELIKAVYASQGMTAPVDYTCEITAAN